MHLGALVPTALLILLSAALGFLVAWNWRGRQFRGLFRQNQRLRRHRKQLSQIHRHDQARLDAAQANQRIAEEELAMLNQAHAALEADHAKLVSRHANLTRTIRKRLAKGGDGDTPVTPEPEQPGTTSGAPAWTGTQGCDPEDSAPVHETGGQMAVEASLADDHPVQENESGTAADIAADHPEGDGSSEPPDTSGWYGPSVIGDITGADGSIDSDEILVATAMPDTAGAEDDIALADTSSGKAGFPAADESRSPCAPSPDAEPASGEQARSDQESASNAAKGQTSPMPTQPASWQALSPEQDLEQFEARLATAPAQLGGLDTSEPAALFPDDTQAADIGEDDEEAFDPIMSAAQELEALRSVLDAREEEIKSLRQQLAPLLGLPLAVSTREAERDRLARRLAEREAEIARLQARMMREAVPVSSPSQSSAAPAAEHETPAEQRLSAEQASRRSGDSPASAGRARSTIVERAAIEPELAPFSANRERTGRLAEQPPTLHSEVPLEDLLNDIRSLDRASDPGRENTAGTSDVAPTLPPPRQGSDLARPPVQEPKTDRSHDVVERDPLTGDAWPDSVAVRQWQEAQTSENPGEPEPPALPPGDHAFADEGGSAHSEPGDAAGAGEDFGNGEPEDSDLDLSESNPGSDDTNVPGRADDSSSNKPRQTPAPGRKDSGIAAAPVMPGIPRQYSLAPERIDDLKRIVGIGPVIERMLNRLGVYQLRQIAAWNADDIEFFDAQLEEFRGRIRRDHWVDQALELSQAQRR